MVSTNPLSPGSPRPYYNSQVPATDEALVVARQAQHIEDPNLPLIGFTNGLPGFSNACFRSALISLLVNLPPLSGWVVSNTQGQLDSSPTAHLLENIIREYFSTNLIGKQIRVDGAIQRWYRHFNMIKPVGPNNIGNNRFDPSTQQDAAEVLFSLMDDIALELTDSRNTGAMDTFHALTEIFMLAEVKCAQCNRATHREPDNQDEQRDTALRLSLISSSNFFKDIVRDAFADTAIPAYCRRCNAVAPRSSEWKIHNPPEVLIVDVDQTVSSPKDPRFSFKPGFQVPTIPEDLDLGEYLHDAVTCTARYRLMGVVNHKGANPNKGHYVSHVRHTSGGWFQIDDAAISQSSMAQLQAYNPLLKANQMIPRLIAYVMIHDDEDINAIATRAVNPQPGPRAFQQPQIIYDDQMTLAQLKALCKDNSLVPGNAKSVESVKTIIDRANSADSRFKTRLKDWVTKTLLTTGTIVAIPPNSTKMKLAAQLAAFMTTQPARAPVSPRVSDPTPGPDPNTGDEPSPTGGDLPAGGQADPSAVFQEALDAANARIANLQRNPTNDAGTSPRSPRAVTTDQIRELIRRLPRGTKRAAEDPATNSFEREKRQAIQLADQACIAIDAGFQLAPALSPNENRRPSNSENQRPPCSPSGSRQSGSPGSDPNLRCHLCPIIDGEIHHMHANVCGWDPTLQVSPPTQSEIDDDLRRIEGQRNTNDSPDEDEEEEEYNPIPSPIPTPTPSPISDPNSGIILNEGDMTRSFLNWGAGTGSQPPRQSPRSSHSRNIPSEGSQTRLFLAKASPRASRTPTPMPVQSPRQSPPSSRSRSIPSEGSQTRLFLGRASPRASRTPTPMPVQSSRQSPRSSHSRSRSIPSEGSQTRLFLGRSSLRASRTPTPDPRQEMTSTRLSPGGQRRSIQDLLTQLGASYGT